MASQDPARTRSIAEKLASRLTELSSMVDDMLRYAAGARDFGQTVAVKELLDSVVENFEPQIDASRALRIDLPDETLTLSGNEDSLRAALLNLVSNAFQAGGAKAVVTIGASSSDGQICLAVTDNGPGVVQEVREHIFEPFFTTRPQGTGLGLAVVRSIAEAHGGNVGLRCDAAGSTFYIYLPLADSGTCEAGRPPSALPALPLAEVANG